MPIAAFSLVVVVMLLTAPSIATAQSASVDPRGYDAVGDSPDAPDIGKVQHSVYVNDALRTIVIGVWLNRSDLAEGERIDVYFDWRPDGEPAFGGDSRFVLYGHAPPSPDTYATERWSNWSNRWVAAVFDTAQVVAFRDGRIYFSASFDPGDSFPQDPIVVGLRVVSTPGAGGVTDYAPDFGLQNLSVSLEPHGAVDPLHLCTYVGECLNPSDPAPGPPGVNPYPPAPAGSPPGVNPFGAEKNPSPACVQARLRLRAVTRRLSRARRAVARAGTRGAKRRQLRRVRRLRQTRSKWKRAVAKKC